MPLQPLRQAVHLGLRQTQRLAHVADGRAPAKADHVRHHGRAAAAVALVDVLDHPLALLVLDVQVDVGRLVPIRRHEPLEHQPGGDGIDHRDAEGVAEDRSRRRAAGVDQDVVAVTEVHQVANGEEIARQPQVLDVPQLPPHALAHRLVEVGIPPPRALPDQALHVAVFGLAVGRGKRRQAVVELAAQVEVAHLGNAQGVVDRLGDAVEELRHFLGGLEHELVIGPQPPPRRFERGRVLDADQHVLQPRTRAVVVVHVVGGRQRQAGAPRDVEQSGVGQVLRFETMVLELEKEAAGLE